MNKGTSKYVKAFKRRLTTSYYELLKLDSLRNLYCRLRYHFLKEKTKTFEQLKSSVGSDTLSHNMDALKNSAAFGMSNRMSLLLYPIAAVLRL